MDTLEQTKQQFIYSTIMNSKASADGDYKTANKHAKILKRIFEKIENGKIDRNILVELLNYEEIRVRGLAAVDLLRIKYEVKKAEEALEKIAGTDETGKRIDEKLTIMEAGIQLKNWKNRGYVDR